MYNFQENINGCGDVYEFNGVIDEVKDEIQDVFDNEILENEALFIAETLVKLHLSEKSDKRNSSELKAKPEERYSDAGINTSFGYIVLRTSKLEVESIHLLYTFIVSYAVLGDPIQSLAALDIDLIWLLLKSVKVIKNDDDKYVMSIIIELDTKNKKQPMSFSDISHCLKMRYPDETKDFNESRIKASLGRLLKDKFVDCAGDYWFISR